ncbi:Reverse transcriptase domain [Arabidopsis suecica]|uniref:Reverse transcriptase domain n=1 Tax=Arabidopsis suecica TaxID=45249 RepID=A0A8T2BSU1_ARASU|nr:Reverse transcriptase domain [Arabidopsis suecica]
MATSAQPPLLLVSSAPSRLLRSSSSSISTLALSASSSLYFARSLVSSPLLYSSSLSQKRHRIAIGAGAFLLKVTNPRIRETILARTMWSIVGHPIFVAPWSPDFNPETPPISSAIVTVELRGVPYLLFNKESLGRIATAVGKPIALAPETARKENFEVAKILVRVNLLKDLPSRVVSGFSDGREIDIDVSYPWLPPKCVRCDQFGHESSLCRTNPPSASGRRIARRSTSRRGRPSRRERLSRKESSSRMGRSRTIVTKRLTSSSPVPAKDALDASTADASTADTTVGISSIAVLDSSVSQQLPHASVATQRPSPQSPVAASCNTNIEKQVELPFILSMTKGWINIRKPLFGAFLETHIREVNSRRIANAIPLGWKFFGNFDHHSSARIVVVWDPRVSVVVYQASSQMVTCGIFITAENVNLTVSFVYGFNQVDQRCPLWEELVYLNANTPVSCHPWAVLGDFNQILRVSHHSDHQTCDVDTTGMDDMNLALQDAELFEAQAKGLVFSWWNNNFPPMFCAWIKECISSPRFSVAINGELAGFFQGKKGLRQGDPLSPYLFIMVMQALSSLLEKATDLGKINLHPKCEAPRITHLLFADDLLVFSNGSRKSLAGIAEVMSRFREMSGLDMNPSKSEIFFGGYSDVDARDLSVAAGITLGTFPTRYLGLPLNPTRISFATLQPFLERITSKIHAWTAKFLSFAGKIRLVSSVIYGMVNFWSSVFVLPKHFYAKVDSLCSAFLWKNKVGSASGARVAWKDICKPKDEAGLGIRLLEEFEVVFRLKQIWNFFSKSGSLWVAWLKGNIFMRKSYWVTHESNRFSKTINSMLQLKPTVIKLLKCTVGDGETASFWYDTWTDFGQLITFLGDAGPRLLRVRKDARVAEASRNGDWVLPAARSDNCQALMVALTEVEAPHVASGCDTYLWRLASGNYCPSFSSLETWKQIRVPSPLVPWAKVVWFKEHVPRYSFATWQAMLTRLPTRDRLRRWGMNIPASCVLCLSGVESHDHLFFECPFSSEIWEFLASKFLHNPPSNISAVSSWITLHNLPSQSKVATILKLLLQIVLYHLWKERNARIFTDVASSAAALRLAIDRSMRDRLLSFPGTGSHSLSLLQISDSGGRSEVVVPFSKIRSLETYSGRTTTATVDSPSTIVDSSAVVFFIGSGVNAKLRSCRIQEKHLARESESHGEEHRDAILDFEGSRVIEKQRDPGAGESLPAPENIDGELVSRMVPGRVSGLLQFCIPSGVIDPSYVDALKRRSKRGREEDEEEEEEEEEEE